MKKIGLCLCCILLLFLVNFEGCIEESGLTTSFTSLTAEQAYDLLNSGSNITIIDCRSCKCHYTNSGHLPNAIHRNDVELESLYNLTIDILFYSSASDGESIEFCQQLINHTYGKLYNLEGGFEAWKEAGYDIEL